jgi:ferredoxin
MKVWIDQDLCTGDGLCAETCPDAFTLLDDGLAYVKEGEVVRDSPGGADGVAVVPREFEDAVVAASKECPGECIFIVQD